MLIKIHPRQAPGGRITDAEDLPAHKTAYAMRDLDHLRRLAAGHGPAIGAYADRGVGHSAAVDQDASGLRPARSGQAVGSRTRRAACARALESEVVSVPLIGRMIERATENQPAPSPTPTTPAAHPDSPATRATSPPRNPATARAMSNKRALKLDGGVA